MKQVIVPAQITTVEDRIIGNISFRQLILLISPIFVATAMYIALPKFMSLSPYKIVIWLPVAITMCLSAIRLKNRLLIDWFMLMINYQKRPGLYVYNKNSLACRPINEIKKDTQAQQPAEQANNKVAIQPSLIQLASLSRLPKEFQFKVTKKGDLSVVFKQTK